jgi:hypothetical protein
MMTPMTRHIVLMSFVLPWLGAAPAIAQTSPACQPLFAAMIKQATTPNHAATTMSNPPMVSETITAGGAIYVKISGAWKKSPLTPQAMVQQQQDNIKNAKSTCKQLPDDAVNGAPAAVYSVHSETPEVGTSDAKVWISKATGLPLRSDANLGGDAKTHMSTTYDYANITAPIVK